MLLFAIDDERNILEEMKKTLADAVEGADVVCFSRGAEALRAVKDGMRPEAVFCDIDMPGISGLALAVELKKLVPDTRIIFSTAYEQYALKAFQVHANGYLLKPLSVQDVREEMAYLPAKAAAPADKLVVKCFGHFDVFFQDKPLVFARRKSKEFLAYLVDRKGAACTRGEIAMALWEEESTGKSDLQKLRSVLNDLKNTLEGCGMADALILSHRQVAIDKDKLDCDYYRMLEGDMDALNSYQGEYMRDYSWAEFTNSIIFREMSAQKS